MSEHENESLEDIRKRQEEKRKRRMEAIQKQDNLRKIKVQRIEHIRKDYPTEATSEEISLLKELYKEASYDSNFLYSTVIRTKSPEQVEALMEGLPPTDIFWTKMFHCLEDIPEDRKIGKNIIQAASKTFRSYTDYDSDAIGLVGFYTRLMSNGFHVSDYPNELVQDPEMATEMLKGLNSRLKDIKEQDTVNNEVISQTRDFLEERAWYGVAGKKGDKTALRKEYQGLTQTVQELELAEINKTHQKDKSRMEDLFGPEKTVQQTMVAKRGNQGAEPK